MAFNFFKKTQNPEIAARVPSGQSLTERFPVLHYGPVPHYPSLDKWDLKIFGEIEEPITPINWEQFLALPQTDVKLDIHCVTRWSKLDTVWTGVRTKDLLEALNVKLKPSAKFVVAHAEYGFTANMPLDVFLHEDAIVAHLYDGKPLEPDHGYPVRLIIPNKYFWKSAKWLRGIEFLKQDKLGFWERNGYNNNADPWKEERYTEDRW